MPTLESQAQVMLIRAIGAVEAALSNMAAAIVQDGGRPAWIEGQPPATARTACAEFIRRIDYFTDDLDPGGTERLQGLIGSSHDTLDRVAEVNARKKDLHELLMCLDCGVLQPPRGQPTQRQWTAQLLANIGRSRFNRRQAIRSFMILEERPMAASYFWGKVRKIIRISRDEAQLMMEKRLAESGDSDPALRYQYEALLNLPADEPLAQVQQLREYPRVNLVFPRPGKPIRKQVMAASPLFYPAEIANLAPEIIPLPDQDKKRPRLRRNDLSIELKPYIPAIRVHRYMNKGKGLPKDAGDSET
jgi:hypothetical protein